MSLRQGSLRRLGRGLGFLRPHQLRLRRERCAICAFPWQIRLQNAEMGVRCLRCGASAVTQSLADVLGQLPLDLSHADTYELSAQGPLVSYLRQRCRSLTLSEYFPDLALGSIRDGIQCQDVQALTFADASFDLCTSTEVFEHVEDDLAGFGEIHRVLRPGGWLVFTVPLHAHGPTQERTALENGVRKNILPPEYHADRYRGAHVFCYRNYGPDIIDRLHQCGFEHAQIRTPQRRLFGFARAVICAQKAR